MKVWKNLIIFLLTGAFLCISQAIQSRNENNRLTSSKEVLVLYKKLFSPESKPSFEAFKLGIQGREKLIVNKRIKNNRFLTIIDFSFSSNHKRLWVIDCDSLKIIHHSLVAHGKNSGNTRAVYFSNRKQSNMSSLGFFVTGETYHGKHGLSLRLDGLEPGFNDLARERAIVIHGAQYATHQFITRNGRLGRSYGCPALPPEKTKNIIQTIKGRSCVFIYYPEKNYLSSSKLISHSP